MPCVNSVAIVLTDECAGHKTICFFFPYTWVTQLFLIICTTTRVVVIEFWHNFCDYNYLSLNRQLTLQLSMLLMSNDYNYRKVTKLQITLLNYRSKY